MYKSVIPSLKISNRLKYYGFSNSIKNFSDTDPVQNYKSLINKFDPNWQATQEEKKKKYEFNLSTFLIYNSISFLKI
jgi:hypothetical protein